MERTQSSWEQSYPNTFMKNVQLLVAQVHLVKELAKQLAHKSTYCLRIATGATLLTQCEIVLKGISNLCIVGRCNL